MTAVTRIELTVETPPIAGDSEPSTRIAALVVAPPAHRMPANPTVLFCVPGGGLTKEYYDLDAEGDRSYSLAEEMARRGCITVALDHPGVGASSKPKDGFLLTPRAVAAVEAAAVTKLKEMLRAGLGPLPPFAAIQSVGVGHSTGGMIAGWIQAEHEPYDALAILGTGPTGAIELLPETIKAIAGDPERIERELVSRVKELFPTAYQPIQRTPHTARVFGGGDAQAARAMEKAADELIVVCGMAVATPGSWSVQAAAIRCPLFIQFGGDDLCSDVHGTVASYKSCTDITLVVTPGMGHCHVLFPTRHVLFDRLAAWVKSIPARC